MESQNQDTAKKKSYRTDEQQQPIVRADSVVEDATMYFRTYARKNPEHVALWCLGIGFVLGWRLKPW